MHIDWLTVAAQIFNFLLLVWLLKRYLYRPIVTAMDRREQRIADDMHGASQREQAAQDCIADYEKKGAELDAASEKLLANAKDAAETERLQLIKQAGRDAAEKRLHWKAEITKEQQGFLANLTKMAAVSVVDLVRRALTDLAGQQLESQIVHTFVEKIRELDEPSREAISQAKGDIQIRTSFKLDEEACGLLNQVLNERTGVNPDIKFVQSPELICGIELTALSQRIAWSVSDYLQTLEQRLREELDTKLAPVK